MKKLLSVLLVVALLFSLSVVAFADGDPNLIVGNAAYGKTYTWYKLFDAVSSGTSVSYYTNETNKNVLVAMNDSEDPSYDADCPFAVEETPVDAKYAVTIKDGKTDAAVINWLKEHYEDLALANGTMNNADGKATATVDPGYYYINTTNGSAVTIDSVLDTVETVYDKNDANPSDLDKLITAENEVAIDPGVDSNEAAVGSVEEFTVSFNAVNYTSSNGSVEKVLNWHITDTPTYLNINAASIKVYVTQPNPAYDASDPESAEYIDVELTKGTQFTASVDDTTGELTVDIPWIVTTSGETYGDLLYTPAAADGVHIPVKIVYEAEVLTGAATAVAPNAVIVEYSHVPAETDAGLIPNPVNPNDPDHPWDPENPAPWSPDHPYTPDDPTTPEEDPYIPGPVPTTPVNPDDDGDDNPDPEVTNTYTYGFNLVKTDADGAPLTGATFQLKNSSDETVYFLRTVDSGHYVFTVCAAGTAGATADIFLEEYNTGYIRGLDLDTYTLIETDAPEGYNKCAPMTITERPSTGTPADGAVLTRVDAAAGFVDYEVENHTGSELPATGGIGTTLFYVLGAILFFGAGAVLIARRKAAER
jgi:LPXTG-motif cell wall-anchored protein